MVLKYSENTFLRLLVHGLPQNQGYRTMHNRLVEFLFISLNTDKVQATRD